MTHQKTTTDASARGLRVAVVVSRYHESITGALCDGARRQFVDSGGGEDDLEILAAPGAFELTVLCRAMAASGRFDAVVALGCIVTGQTTHDRHIADAVAQGLTAVSVRTGVPVAFGVLTCQSQEQARARAGGALGNKGVEAMAAAVQAANAIRAVSAAGIPAREGS